jgi:hypothetical protein
LVRGKVGDVVKFQNNFALPKFSVSLPKIQIVWLMKIWAFSLFFVFAGISAFSQDSVRVSFFNRSQKNVYVALAYYKRMPEGDVALCTYGWFEVKKEKSKTLWLKNIQREKGVFYHAHNVVNRNDNWGGSLFYMVHPTSPFHIAYANNSALASALDNELNSQELQQLEAYPFREMKWNPKGFFQVNLLE